MPNILEWRLCLYNPDTYHGYREGLEDVFLAIQGPSDYWMLFKNGLPFFQGDMQIEMNPLPTKAEWFDGFPECEWCAEPYWRK